MLPTYNHTRRSARAIIINPKKQLLLMQVQGGPTQKTDKLFWCTLGGEIENDESAVAALKRELKEEAGIDYTDHCQLIAHGEQTLLWNNVPTLLVEQHYIVKIKNADLNQTNLTNEEKKIVKNYRWWNLNDLAKTDETVFPKCLASLVQDYLDNATNWKTKKIDLS